MSCFTTAADRDAALAVAWILPTADAAGLPRVRQHIFGMCVFLLDVFFDREIVGEILVVKKAVGNGVDVVGCGFVGIILIL